MTLEGLALSIDPQCLKKQGRDLRYRSYWGYPPGNTHLGKRKTIFKYAVSGGYVNSLEGNLLVTYRQQFLGYDPNFFLSWLTTIFGDTPLRFGGGLYLLAEKG